MRIPRRSLQEGGRIPRGYGVAYIDLMRMEAVCYPIPFNLVVNAARKLYHGLLSPSIEEREKEIYNAYQRGKCEGWRARQKRLDSDFEQFMKERRELRENTRS